MYISPNTAEEESKLSEKPKPKQAESLFSAISVGFSLILIGALFVTTPNLLDKIAAFFSDFGIVQVPNAAVIFLPAPVTPNAHLVLYSAVTQFCFMWGIYQIVILVFRLFASSSLDKKAKTASNTVFWLGASYLVSTFLNASVTITTWFAFWALIIMLIGVSLIIRAIILAVRK